MYSYLKLISDVAKREGKRSQAHIADIKEIISILIDMEMECLFDAEKDSIADFLKHQALLRSKKKKKKGYVSENP